ncbi:hypothetical protein [Leptothrix discophora]|uniref:SGNH hydrolase-type esterase domain-containing protein n=1 Tax=Leptothrix discophora TaxID=89 RepID=A0ABT9G1L3_LEPDI|nr:hypothetical protein [Leptothrix discophora]MDP4300351.1 hypothetical protein [Leptothrix discophora]
MQITMRRATFGAQGVLLPEGLTHDVDDATALRWIGEGAAVAVGDAREATQGTKAAPSGLGGVTVGDIADAGAAGRSLLSATTQTDARIALGLNRIPAWAWNNASELRLFGDSFTHGAATSVYAEQGYAQRFARHIGFTLGGSPAAKNLAADGHGWLAAAIRATEANAFTAGAPNARYAATYLLGYNDVRFMGGGPGMQALVRNCLRFLLCQQWAKTVYPANAMTVGGSVTTGSYAAGGTIGRWSLSNKLSGAAGGFGIDHATLTASGTTTLTQTGIEAGTIAVVGIGSGRILAADGGPATTGNWAGLRDTLVSIDGRSLTTLVNGSEQAGTGYAIAGSLTSASGGGSVSAFTENSASPTVGLYSALDAKAHTVVLSNGLPAPGITSSSNRSWFADCVIGLEAPQKCAPAIVGLTPKTVLWNNGGANYNYGSDAEVDALDAVIQSVVAEFQALGYPVAWVPTMDHWDNVGAIHTDNIHPTYLGHSQLLNAFKSAL